MLPQVLRLNNITFTRVDHPLENYVNNRNNKGNFMKHIITAIILLSSISVFSQDMRIACQLENNSNAELELYTSNLEEGRVKIDLKLLGNPFPNDLVSSYSAYGVKLKETKNGFTYKDGKSYFLPFPLPFEGATKPGYYSNYTKVEYDRSKNEVFYKHVDIEPFGGDDNVKTQGKFVNCKSIL